LWRIIFYTAVSNPNGVTPVLPAARAPGPIGHNVCVKKRHDFSGDEVLGQDQWKFLKADA
jgi:hypothetical protein